MSANSTRKARPRKRTWALQGFSLEEPYVGFPLSPHGSGAWQKKINGRIYYFGKWAKRVNGKLERIEGDTWKEALDLYKAQAEDLHAGRTPRPKTDALTVKQLGDRFLTAKLNKVTCGELGSRSYQEYRETCQLVADTFGKDRLVEDLAADDFEKLRKLMAERWGPVRLGNAITRVKGLFKFGFDNALLDKPIRYGSEFKKPGKAVLRRHRATNGERMLEPHQIQSLLDKAGVQFKAMILLGINCGFGNHDVATVPLSAIDLERRWVDFARPKTGIARRCPLWPETAAALRAAIAERPNPRNGDDAVFIQSSGLRWVRNTDHSRTDKVAVHFTDLCKACDLYHEGRGFYALRHVHRTIADAARDPVAIDLIMGHTDPTMGGHYRERIDDSRLQAVADYVRAWLFTGKVVSHV